MVAITSMLTAAVLGAGLLAGQPAAVSASASAPPAGCVYGSIGPFGEFYDSPDRSELSCKKASDALPDLSRYASVTHLQLGWRPFSLFPPPPTGTLTRLPKLPPNLTNLYIASTGLTNLANLPTAPKLTAMDIVGNPTFPSLKAAGKLTRLESFSFDGKGIIDLSPLGAVKSLRSIEVTTNNSLDDPPTITSRAKASVSLPGPTGLDGKRIAPASMKASDMDRLGNATVSAKMGADGRVTFPKIGSYGVLWKQDRKSLKGFEHLKYYSLSEGLNVTVQERAPWATDPSLKAWIAGGTPAVGKPLYVQERAGNGQPGNYIFAEGYQWYVGGKPVSGATGYSFTPRTDSSCAINRSLADGCNSCSTARWRQIAERMPSL